MRKIEILSDIANQSMEVTLENGDRLQVTMQYISANMGWYISLIYGSTLTINMRRVVTSPNLIRALRNIIPFGIACVTKDGYEPIYKDDFSSGRAELYVLSPEDVQYVESNIVVR